MERFVKPKVHELEALLKDGDVDSVRAKRVREYVYAFEWIAWVNKTEYLMRINDCLNQQ